MDNQKPAPPQVLLVVSNVDGGDPKIEKEHYDHGDAHAHAEEVAKSLLDRGGMVSVFRRIATYEAEIKVNMKREGE
jgi:hypothetical protein